MIALEIACLIFQWTLCTLKGNEAVGVCGEGGAYEHCRGCRHNVFTAKALMFFLLSTLFLSVFE